MSRQNQRYAQRLTKLHDYVKAIPAAQYHHDTLVEALGKEPCGTVACAFGHAIASGQFPGLLCDVRNKRTKISGGYLTKIEYEFKPIRERGKVIYHYPDADDWANHYFGPGTWQGIFNTFPYLGYGSDNATIRKKVLANLQKYAKQFAKA